MNEIEMVIDWLTYLNYEYNRKRNPHIAPHRWRKLFKDAEQFEEIYERNYEKITGSQ